jgi:hypothetical protein
VSEARFRINDELTAAKVFDDEAIVINVVSGRYYDLEGAGAVAWGLITAGASADEVADALVARFEVDPETARRDVDALLEQLLSEELLLPARDASAPGPPDSPAAGRTPYTPPALATYTDMEDLLTVDPPLPAAYTPRP